MGAVSVTTATATKVIAPTIYDQVVTEFSSNEVTDKTVSAAQELIATMNAQIEEHRLRFTALKETRACLLRDINNELSPFESLNLQVAKLDITDDSINQTSTALKKLKSKVSHLETLISTATLSIASVSVKK